MSELYGTLHMVEGCACLRFERRFQRPPGDIWRAITDSAVLRCWFPADLQGERSPDAMIRIVSFTGRFPPSTGRFNVFEPNRLLEYTWANEVMRWELRADGDACDLTFTNVLDGNAVETGVASIAAAWHACLDMLRFVLNQETPPFSVDDRFTQISAEYADRFASPT